MRAKCACRTGRGGEPHALHELPDSTVRSLDGASAANFTAYWNANASGLGGPAIELFAPAFAAEVREIVRDAAHSIALLRASAHFDLRLPSGPADARAARAAAAVPDGDGDVCEGLPRLWLVWSSLALV